MRSGHVAAVDHVAARLEAHLAHGEIVRAQRVAQSAQRAAVDHAIGLAQAHDDADVVVDVAHVALRIGPVVLEEFARLDAFHAVAGEAARRFGHRLVTVVAMLGRRRLDRRLGLVGGDVDVEAGGRGAVVGAARRQRSALQEAIDRSRRATAVVGRADRRIDLAGRAMNAAAEDFRRGWWRASSGSTAMRPAVGQANDRRRSRAPDRDRAPAAPRHRTQSTRRARAGRRSPTMRDRQRISTPSVVRAPRSASIAEGGKTSA